MKISNLVLTCSFCFPFNFAFVQNDSDFIRKSEVQPTTRVVQRDIISLQHTYVPPHVKGDKDFNGNCDLSSTATLKISADQTKLYIELYFKAKEPHSDSTEASGIDTFIIFDTKDRKKKS
jgi:hypothetical protein